MVNINFTPFPILTTERLTLRPLSIEDQQPIFELRTNPEVNQYLDRAPSKHIEDVLQFIAKITEAVQKNQAIYWVISLTGSNTVVGTVCLFDFSSDKNSCEIGYELLPHYQGQGLMKEAIQEVITYVFQTLKCTKIVAFTHTENQPSKKLLVKLHFVKSATTDPENPNLMLYTLEQLP